MDISLILFFAGSCLIFLGSNLLIDNSKSIATTLGISPIVIGLTVIALGTSLPELVVSVLASIKGESDVVIGNVVGSNISNITLVLGLILFLRPITVDYAKISKDFNYLLFVTSLLIVLGTTGMLNLFSGLFLLFLFILFIKRQFSALQNGVLTSDSNKEDFRPIYLFYIFIGILMLGYGSELFISGAIGIAKFLGIPLIIISLSAVALGTSLPELITSIVAINKNEPSFVIGNIIGSNIINIVLVLGSSLLINPINDISVIYISFIILAFSTLAMYLFSRYRKKLSKFDGLILLSIYLLFIYFNFMS